MNNISGIILTKNNEKMITECVQSILPVVDELIIIDDFSTDNTLNIIKEKNPKAKIHQKTLIRFDKQRNYAIDLASHNWILMIDSDEIISPELAKSIQDLKEENFEAYWVTRMNKLFDTYLPEKYVDRPILFKKKFQFINPVHEIIKVDKKKYKKLSGNLIHNNWLGIDVAMQKMNRYSSMIADKWIEQKRSYGKITLWILAIILPIRYFFICLFKKKFYRAGIFTGIFYSLLLSSWWLAVIFKYRDKKNN
jgi:hypothetical protein